MITINLSDDGFHVIDGRDTFTVNYWSWGPLPCYQFAFNHNDWKKGLPPIAQAYEPFEHLIDDMSDEQRDYVLYKLIDIYVPIRYFRVKHFAELPMVIGFIGPRGSGKTCSAANLITMDYLIRGKQLWSNIPIAVKVKYKALEKVFTSEPLDKLDLLDITAENITQGIVFIDEINMEAAEGSRYMSAANLQFSYALQQIRKRQLSVVWTCQGFNWVDSRTRWQTDFVINCQDAYIHKKVHARHVGDKSTWVVYDVSGMTGKYDFDYQIRSKYITDFPIWKGYVWNRPWWHAYDTYALQGQDDYISVYKNTKKIENRERQYLLAEQTNRPVVDYVESYLDACVKKVYAADIWKVNGIEDKAEQMRIGKAFQDAGYIRRRDDKGYFYELP